MLSSSKLRISAFLAVLFLSFAALPATQSVQAKDDRVPVFGKMIVSNPPTGCNSPLGTCFVGTINGNVINGSVNGEADGIKEVDDKKGNPIAFILTGTFTITTPHGTLSGNATFFQNFPALTGHGTLVITGGTNHYKHTTGTILLEEPKPPVPPVPNGVQTFFYAGSLKGVER